MNFGNCGRISCAQPTSNLLIKTDHPNYAEKYFIKFFPIEIIIPLLIELNNSQHYKGEHMSEITIKMPDIKGQLELTIEKIQKEKEKFSQKASLYEKYNSYLTFFISILASATPALVAYQASAKEDFWKIFSIFIIAIAGALTTLQNGFKFSEKKARYKITELNLTELESDVIIKRYEILNSGNDELMQFSNLRKLNHNCSQRLTSIIKGHIQGEIAIVEKHDYQEKEFQKKDDYK